MAEGHSVGTVYVELDLDASRYLKGQQQLYKDATSTSLSIEQNFKNLGIKSGASFDLMRAKAVNAFEMIASSSKATANDRLRAEEALNAQLSKLNEQQFGKQTSALQTLKSNWLAIGAVVYGVVASFEKAFEFVKLGAAAQQAETSFRSVASSAGESADDILSSMKRATAGTIDDSAMMQKATKGMVLGLSGEDMTSVAKIARLSARTMGTDVASAFDMIADSVSTKMPRALRQAGLITKEEMQVINEAVSAGVENVNLLPIALDGYNRALQKMGPITDNAAEEIQKINAQWSELKETVGVTMIAVIMGLVHPLDTVTKSLKTQTGELGYLTDEFGRVYKLPKSMAPTATLGEALSAPSPDMASYMFGASAQGGEARVNFKTEMQRANMRAKVDFDALVREGIVNKADVPALIEKFAGKDKDWAKYLTNRKQNISDLQNILKGIETVQADKQSLLNIEDTAYAKKSANADKVRAIDEKTYTYMQNKTLAYYDEDTRLSELKSRAMDATGERQIKLLDEYIAKAGEISSKYGTEGAGGLTGKSIMMDMASGIEQASRMQQDAYDQIESNQKQKVSSDQAMLENLITNINGVKVEIDGMYSTLDRPMNIKIQTDEAMSKIKNVQDAITALISKGSQIGVITSGASGGSLTATTQASGFDYNAMVPEEPIPVTFEPEITMSPAVPFREGVANMQDMLAGLGSSVTGTVDLTNMTSMVTLMSSLAKQIEQVGSVSEQWSATPGYKMRAAAEVRQYQELYNMGLQAMQGMGGGASGSGGGGVNVVFNIQSLNVGSGTSTDSAKQIDEILAGEIKYGRSKILQELQAARVMQ